MGHFHFLPIMNDAAIDKPGKVFMWTYVFISVVYIPGSGIAGPYGNSVMNHLRNSDCKMMVPFYFFN